MPDSFIIQGKRPFFVEIFTVDFNHVRQENFWWLMYKEINHGSFWKRTSRGIPVEQVHNILKLKEMNLLKPKLVSSRIPPLELDNDGVGEG